MRISYFSCLQGFAQTEKHVCVQRECGHRWPKQQVRCRDLADFTSKQSSEVWWNMVKLKIVQMARCSDEQHGTASSSSSQLLMRCLKCHLLSFQHTGSWSSSSGSSEGSPPHLKIHIKSTWSCTVATSCNMLEHKFTAKPWEVRPGSKWLHFALSVHLSSEHAVPLRSTCPFAMAWMDTSARIGRLLQQIPEVLQDRRTARIC